MSRTRRQAAMRAAPPQTFLECLRYFLAPPLWRQLLPLFGPYQARRWRTQPLLLVLLLMTWCAGESAAERFETARAFYVASYQRQRRPGKTVEGFQRALARVPMRVWRTVAVALRQRLLTVFASRLSVAGFVPFGCDGSQLTGPRSDGLRRLRAQTSPQAAPVIFLSALVHLSTGLLWSWRLGGPCASERDHLVRLLSSLPWAALVVADAGYVGYELLRQLVTAQRWFLIRLNGNAPLYPIGRVAFSRRREGEAYYWPAHAQRHQQPPVRVRVIRLRGKRTVGAKKADVWLMTNVLDSARLPRATASQFYRWRWRNEGLFRTYKRTLGKVKLFSRTLRPLHREAEGSLLAVQLLLAHGVLALPTADAAQQRLPSARQVLVAIRVDIGNQIGRLLGPRQRQSYRRRLEQMRLDRRRHRKDKVRRRWPSRQPHKPPKPPRLLKMGTDLKDLLAQLLAAPA